MQLTRSEFVEYIKQNIDELSSFEVMAGCPITDDLVTFLNKPKSQFLKEEFSSYDKTGHEGMLLVPPTIASAMIELAKGRLKDEPWNRRVLLADKWGSLIMCCINSLYDGCLGAFLSEGIKDTKPYDRAIIGYIYKYCISIVLDESGMSFLKYIFLPKLLMYKDFSLDTSSLYTDKNKLRLKSNMNIVALREKACWYNLLKDIPLLNESGFESINKQYKQLPYLTYQFVKQRLENGREDFNMKFDVVIGNPPYNNDLYLDFVQTGYNLLKDDGVMVQITPAKWQAKGGAKNEDFRAKIVPHMKEIVYYPDCKDIFDIHDPSGISYYSIYKEYTDEKKQVSVVNVNKNLRSNEIHNISVSLFGEKIRAIIDKCIGNSNKLHIEIKTQQYAGLTEHEDSKTRILETDVEYMQGEKLLGYKALSKLKTTQLIDKWKACICFMPTARGEYYDGIAVGCNRVWKLKPNQVPKGSFVVLRWSDSEQYIDNFASYFECKLIRFLYQIGICGTTLTEEFYRFVPDPGQFDHIFTDDELYKKYNLTQDEINIIESVIKERK